MTKWPPVPIHLTPPEELSVQILHLVSPFGQKWIRILKNSICYWPHQRRSIYFNLTRINVSEVEHLLFLPQEQNTYIRERGSIFTRTKMA
ncbi:hypothetical protein AFLA_003399 [Aspergillus flavus NRRL3357]|nr:hypothetical protein AFLA_003399 [Aspergillus flavus NRRL3357]